jgi:hypothetical protein
MVKISGPVSVGVVSLYDKQIFLFGDIHTMSKGLCPKCTEDKKCFYLTEFIDSLKNVDVFIEEGWFDADTKYLMKNAPSSSESVLHNVRAKYKDYLYGFKVQPNKRFHYTDIRQERTLFPLTRLVLYFEFKDIQNITEDDLTLALQFTDAKYLQKFVDIIVRSDDYTKSIKSLFNAPIAKRFFLSNPFSSNKQNSKIHRIRKQILKLPKTQQQKLLRFHKDRCLDITNSYNQILSKCNKVIDNSVDFVDLIVKIINDGILPMLTHLMDMYLLARLLYYVKKKDTKQILTYTGSMHTDNYVTFFTKYMKEESKLLYQEDNTESKRIKRCVSLPANILVH